MILQAGEIAHQSGSLLGQQVKSGKRLVLIRCRSVPVLDWQNFFNLDEREAQVLLHTRQVPKLGLNELQLFGQRGTPCCLAIR